MQHIYNIYLEIIKSSCENRTYSGILRQENIAELSKLAEKHFTAPFLLPYINTGDFFQALKYQTKMMMFHYYQIEHFTDITAELLNKNSIPYFLLKGISLASYYPSPEYRKLGDLDIYIPEPKDFSRAQKLLETHGYTLDPEISDHHVTYTYTFPKTGRTYILELHFRIVGKYQYERANQIVDSIYSSQVLSPCMQSIRGKTYSVLPPTEYTFYMIHHMLKHYLYSGFGIRLLCDFSLYLTAHHEEINFSELHTWCSESRIFHLYEIILESCRLWLGLSCEIDKDVHYNRKGCEAFIRKVLSDSDMGTNEERSLVNSGSYKQVNLLTYFKEGHLQMQVRFPRLGKWPVLWPALWLITFFCFLHNTYHLRRTTLRETLKDFKESNKASQIIQVFDNSKDQK